jgi:beta-glucan synthesis-associated protein KRE6
MILYRYASEDGVLSPPIMPASNRDSIASFSSISSDSKYPVGSMNSTHGLIAYAYDPSVDDKEPIDDEDRLHDPHEKLMIGKSSVMGWRGFFNIATLVLLVVALLALFVALPVVTFVNDDGRNARIIGNTRINATGQAES